MALINTIIPLSNFEIVRTRIGEILFTEFARQFALTANPDINPSVYEERFIPVDNAEFPVINVSWSGAGYSNKDQTQVDGDNTYNIDCYAGAEADGDSGDKIATLKLHRLLAIARAIFEAPVYNTLGYAKPFSCNVRVASISIADPVRNNDATHQIQGRLELSIRVPETNLLIPPPQIGTHTTQVKLELTDKGYRYTWGTLTNISIGTAGNAFTLPLEYTGMQVVVVSDGNQSYTTGVTQSGDVITMTNGVTFTPGQVVVVNLRLEDFTAQITIAADGDSFTLPAAYEGKTIQLVNDGNQTYVTDSFTQSGLTVTMTNGVQFTTGQQVIIWYGLQLVTVSATAGNQFILPAQYRNFDQVLVFDGNQSYSEGYDLPEVITTMNNGVTFTNGQQLIIAVR